MAGQGRAVSFDLEPGLGLVEAIGRPLRALGCASAVLEIEGGAFGPFAYVIPALSATSEHAAFYSETFRPVGESMLEDGRVTFGVRDGAPFLHCHAFWREADGMRRGGHVLPMETTAAAPIRARAWALDGLVFTALPDAETNFTLFGPVPAPCAREVGGVDGFFGLRLRPNQDICAAIEVFCHEHGIARAEIRGGVGSIIGAEFADGRRVEPFATEMFIRRGQIAPGADGLPEATLDVALVDCTRALAEGRLRRGANPVLMTVELVLEPTE